MFFGVAISLPLLSSVLLSMSHSLTANMVPNPRKYRLDNNTTILAVHVDNDKASIFDDIVFCCDSTQ